MLKVILNCTINNGYDLLRKSKTVTCKDWTLLSSSAIYWSFRTRDLWAYCLQLTWKIKKLNRYSSFKVYQHQSSWTLDIEHASPFDGGIIQVCIYWQQREVQCTWRCAPILCSSTSKFKDVQHWQMYATCTIHLIKPSTS